MCMLINVPTLPPAAWMKKPFRADVIEKRMITSEGVACPLTGRDNLLESGLHYRGKSFRYLLNITWFNPATHMRPLAIR